VCEASRKRRFEQGSNARRVWQWIGVGYKSRFSARLRFIQLIIPGARPSNVRMGPWEERVLGFPGTLPAKTRLRLQLLESMTEGHAATILIVDMDRDLLRELAGRLRRAGYEVFEAASFEEGKRLLSAKKPAALIADIRLGQFNGLHLLLRGRVERPDMRAIITSNFADAVLEAETRRLGGTFVPKPFAYPELLATLGQVLAEKQPGRLVERRVAERRQAVVSVYAPERRVGQRRSVATR